MTLTLGEMHACLAALVFYTRFLASSGVGWNYKPGMAGGPEDWYKDYADCGKNKQSPINIEKETAHYSPMLPYLDFSDYSKTKGVDLTLVNKGGHTVEVDITGEPIYLKAGGLPVDYKLVQFHFHWGSNSSLGSEHQINGRRYPMELHLVHHQVNLNLSVAQKVPTGLAVVAFFFQVNQQDNEQYEKMLKHFPKIQTVDLHEDNVTRIETFPLADLLPDDLNEVDFYRYEGSLTTPPCHESVIWSVATKFIEISEKQINIFRDLYDEDHLHLVDDFRPVQPLNHRLINTTVQPGDYEYNKGTSTQRCPERCFQSFIGYLLLLLCFRNL